MIHLPPGAKERSRNLSIDFFAPWKNLFIDDLRSSRQLIEGRICPPIQSLLHSTPHELIANGLVDLSSIIKDKFQSSLAACIAPKLQGSHAASYSYGNRIRALRGSFEHPEILPLLTRCTEQLIEKAGSIDRASGLPTHLALALGPLAGSGSCRETLLIALESVILQALSHVFRQLDRNFNLSMAPDSAIIPSDPAIIPSDPAIIPSDPASSGSTFKIWLLLAQSPAILKPIMLAIGGKTEIERGISRGVIPNDGLHGPLVSAYPFSWAVLRVLEGTRKAIQSAHSEGSLSFESLHQRLEVSCQGIFGTEVTATWDTIPPDHVKGIYPYLHDYVSLSAPRFPGLEIEDLFLIYRAVIAATGGAHLASSPCGVHSALWYSENRIFNLCATLSKVSAIPYPSASSLKTNHA